MNEPEPLPTIATEKDGPGILALSRHIAGFNDLDVECIEELWYEYLAKGAEASGYQFTVMGEAGRVLGFACFGPTPLTRGVYDLYWLAVDPDERRRGAGRKLVAQMEAQIRAQQGRLILIETSSGREYQAARRFYESCGYHYQAVIHDFYDIGDDLLTFGKKLD
jgi:ribosomal protein S18 acetylase RimI-like enzyme